MHGVPILGFTFKCNKCSYSAVVIFTYFLQNKWVTMDKEQTELF